MISERKRTLVSRKVSYEEAGKDLYQTPCEITEYLLNRLEIPKGSSILEPANGLGAISKVIIDRGYACETSDIRDGVDFLETSGESTFDYIITNPPYKYAQEFVEKSMEHLKAGGRVAMLLRLSFLESSKRYHFFKDSGLRTVYVSCKRITMFPYGNEAPKNSGTLAYAWYVWEKGYKGIPHIEWFNY